MKREEYINLRRFNSEVDIVYNFYYEECTRRNLVALDKKRFRLAFIYYPYASQVALRVIQIYDSKFEVTILRNKQGVNIAIL